MAVSTSERSVNASGQTADATRRGPLTGLRVIEFGAIGPVPFCGMLLADLGADVVRIDPKYRQLSPVDVHARGKRAVALNLKSKSDVSAAKSLLCDADVALEGFRPGVMERLGLGPDVALALNPRLIYGRMTGWGQTGPLAQVAGHDINYMSLAGALGAIGPKEGVPIPPLNLVGDFGGGSLYLAMGVLAAIYERQNSGLGQVIDAAMVDGTASLLSIFSMMAAAGIGEARRGYNMLDGSAHFYRAYECADGKYISLGAIEPEFYNIFRELLGEDAPENFPGQAPEEWAQGAEMFARLFKTRSRDQWCALLEGTDACFAPVLEFDEAPEHPHLKARGTYQEAFGITQAAPAPRFSRTEGAIQGPPPSDFLSCGDVLAEWRAHAKYHEDA